MARIFLLGIISGFPWVLIGTSLSLWLQEDGLSRSTIGWAGLIFGVYAFNFLWAPLIDRIRVPWLTGRLGHRRAWIVVLQAVILLCLVLWSALEPTEALPAVIAVGLVIAIASASQDITIDAMRIEQFGTGEAEAMSAGAATAVVGWWTGFKLGGVIALETAGAFQSAGVAHYWQATFLVLGGVVLLCNIGLMFVREAAAGERIAAQAETDAAIAARLKVSGPLGSIAAWLAGTVAGPLMSFFRRNGVAIARRGAGLHPAVQDRRGVPGPHVAHLLQGDRLHEVRHRALLQGAGLDHHRHVHAGGRILRDPRRPGAGHVPRRDRHGLHQPPVRRARLDRQVGGAVRGGRGRRRPHQRIRYRHLRRLHLDAGGPHLHRHAIRAAGLHRHRGGGPFWPPPRAHSSTGCRATGEPSSSSPR